MRLNHITGILVASLAFALTVSCGESTRASLSGTPVSLSSYDDRVSAVYASDADRFRIECYLSLPDGRVKNSAVLPRSASKATLDLKPFSLKIEVLYPSHIDAAEQAKPMPFLLYNYEVSRGSEILGTYLRQRSLSHTLLIEIPGQSGEHKCLLLPLPSDPIEFSAGQRPLVHVNVHPHRTYDPTNLLSGKIEPLLRDVRIKSYLLLEAQKLPYELSSFLLPMPQPGYPWWNPLKSFSLGDVGSSSMVIAPQGEFAWKDTDGGSFPPRVLMTGGFFKACMTRQLAFLNMAFHRSAASMLNLIFIDQLILKQPADVLNKPSELGAVPAEPTEAREEGEKSFLHLLKAFNRSYAFDDSDLEYRFTYSTISKNARGECDPHSVAGFSEQKSGHDDSSKKVVVFNMVKCQ